MVNPPPVLNQLTWGVHLNFERFLASPPTSPDWLVPLQRQDWQRRGLVVWDVELRLVAHLYAGYALDVLEHMRATEEWKTSGFLIGSPTYQLPINRTTEQLPQTANGIWSLQNEIELAPNRAQVFFDFLISQGRSLEHISICDKEDAEEALGKVYRLVATYGRKVREGRQGTKFLETSKKTVSPTTLPKGSYFTVSQATQVCGATSKQIRAWIRRSKLEAIELPGLGIIIEIEKLNEFLCRRNS